MHKELYEFFDSSSKIPDGGKNAQNQINEWLKKDGTGMFNAKWSQIILVENCGTRNEMVKKLNSIYDPNNSINYDENSWKFAC